VSLYQRTRPEPPVLQQPHTSGHTSLTQQCPTPGQVLAAHEHHTFVQSTVRGQRQGSTTDRRKNEAKSQRTMGPKGRTRGDQPQPLAHMCARARPGFGRRRKPLTVHLTPSHLTRLARLHAHGLRRCSRSGFKKNEAAIS